MTELEIQECIRVLETMARDGAEFATLPTDLRVKLMRAAGQVSRPHKEALRVRHRELHRAREQRRRSQDKALRNQTGIRQARQNSVFSAPVQQLAAAEPALDPLQKSRHCYICKNVYTELHFFYDALCVSCAEFNYQKRFQTADLSGQVALITGARLKIGYQASLMLLRAGAKVIATTRFPQDAAERFAREQDFSAWGDRLEIFGVDLRHTPSVDLFAQLQLARLNRLDILINNAAQTVRRPPEFYAHLLSIENNSYLSLNFKVQKLLAAFNSFKAQLEIDSRLPVSWHGHRPGVGISRSAELSQIPYAYDLSSTHEFPKGELDADLQQIDQREQNSWRLKLDAVPTLEMLEVQLVNSVAPFILCSRFGPLLRQSPGKYKHIVNVSAMEGKFSRYTKTEKHPHTNMAKAALNMLTHTCASELANDRVYMNAVDTGWVTDEDPLTHALRKREVHDFQPPLDIVDGAARVCDPIFAGLNTGEPWCGRFLKDYFPTEW